MRKNRVINCTLAVGILSLICISTVVAAPAHADAAASFSTGQITLPEPAQAAEYPEESPSEAPSETIRDTQILEDAQKSADTSAAPAKQVQAVPTGSTAAAPSPAPQSSAPPAATTQQSAPAHTHNFNIPVTESRSRQVLISPERVENVDTGRGKYICNGCGADVTGNLDHTLTCNGGSGYHMEPVYEQRVIPAQYRTEQYEETVGYRCSCGARN